MGREAELAAIQGFVGSTGDGFATLALEGEAGIGKTTLWQAAIRDAELRGHTALTCRAASPETPLSFAGLGDLLSSVSSRVVAALPGPQRRARRSGVPNTRRKPSTALRTNGGRRSRSGLSALRRCTS
jgi:hypothetical protein